MRIRLLFSLLFMLALAAGCALFLYVSYTMPIAAGLLAEGKSWTVFGPFRLGIWSKPLAVITIIWGLALTAHEVLPRVGYAKTRLAWRCHDPHAAAPSATPVSVATRLVEVGAADLAR